MGEIKFHNTESGKLESFTPHDPDQVKLYVCGPTVYDHIHIGNARPLVVFDVLVRFLRSQYQQVIYVRNITDIDDKINARAFEQSITIQELTATTTKEFHNACAQLGCLPPSFEPKATEFIPQMLDLIKKLISKGHAYEAEGHVLFHVPSMPEYGQFARKDRDDMIAGSRVEVAPYKKDPADFILWKPSDQKQPGWASPWGYGRPGWHTECSAMAKHYLGDNFDIHGGGLDLVFPHHQNEVAQSCCAYPKSSFAQLWMHNGYVLVDGVKMSKSLGNFHSVRDLLLRYPAQSIRLVLLQTHYRQPLDFTFDKLSVACHLLDRFYDAVQRTIGDEAVEDTKQAEPHPEIINALSQDLNTPKALAILFEILTAINKSKGLEAIQLVHQLLASANLLGLLYQPADEWFKGSCSQIDSEWIDAMIIQRQEAKQAKDFKTADQLREELRQQGIILMDGPDGTSWRLEHE